ncbi:hypothetical protein GTPT_2436 [Tatumella ptyseos ATCC 33301]|uniref:Uncharacterized protein n=2 Tax=Tatumella ptyseos TaxID=82987 RepID=A0A085JDX9_9GAMM|nr:hypothetical protein [Tatumella ptyseos]KFD18675.1 hypothetical protein GTPT_2436 [Tatumella ptyseos ATCC 33301]SQK74601.1 Uncharacterised protein [Tatumella ptyseos]
MLLLLKFLHPYLMFSNLAAWGLAQNLEGLGLFHSINDLPLQVGNDVIYPWNLSPTHGVNGLSGLMTILLLPIALLNIRAGFYLNRCMGWISLFLWILPGAFSLMGYVPDFTSFGPDVFRFGSGFTGSVSSAAANLLISMVSGWSIIMLFSALWKKNIFKNAYDHIWYVLGLTAALYYVTDSGLPSYKEDLSEAGERTTLIMQHYRNGEQNLEDLCKEPDVINQVPDLCSLEPEMRWSLQSSFASKDILRARIDLPDWVTRVAYDRGIGKQIETFNALACSAHVFRGNCEIVPIEMDLSGIDYKTPRAFLTPVYAQRLLRLHESMQKADSRIKDIEQGHNSRYFVFLMLAFVAGGKLANTSRSMVSHDTVRPRSWLLSGIRSIVHKTLLVIKFFTAELVLPLLQRLVQRVKWHTTRIKNKTPKSAEEHSASSGKG